MAGVVLFWGTMEQVKKITILGKEVTLKMNMAVLIGYEGLTDKTFLGETFETVRDRYADRKSVV